MMKFLAILFNVLFALTINAQIVRNTIQPQWNTSKGIANSTDSSSLSSIPVISLETDKLSQIKLQDAAETINKIDGFQFGIAIDSSINVLESATSSRQGSMSRFQLILKSPGAYSINLNFDHFYLPEGSQFYIRSKTHKDVLGALGSHNNKINGEFSIRPIQGDAIELDLFVPTVKIDSLELQISQLIHAYKDLFHKRQKSFNSSGNCNINTNCPEADLFQDIKRSVVMILASNNTRLCTGTLINNARQDSTPYLLTASHCNLATNSIFVFGYENSSLSCQTNADGSLSNSISGAIARSESNYSDFKLFELSTTPPASYKPYYSGWDARGIAPYESTTIHHPSGDIKKFSQDHDTATSSAYSAPNTNTHWQVGNWELGTTEQGSSGSSLFDQNKRIIGQLEGGSASCSQNLEDYFGKFSLSWDYNPATNRQLKYWLDPDTTNQLSLDGLDPLLKLHAKDVELTYVSNVPAFTCDTSIQAVVHFMNVGNDSLSSVQIEYGTNYNYGSSISWTGILKTDELTTQNLPNYPLQLGDTIFNVRLKLTPLDQDSSNNNWEKLIKANPDPIYVNLRFKTDEYGNELSWDIRDTGDSRVLHQGGPYVLAPDTSGLTYQYNLCLYEGCFNFNLYDAYGDGFTSPFNGKGNVLITGPYGDTLLYEANFTGSQKTIQFCINDTLTAIVEYQNKKQFSIYPNPIKAGERIFIKDINSTDFILSLFDIQGRVVVEQRNNTLEIPSRLKSGMYILQLTNGQGVIGREKILIE